MATLRMLAGRHGVVLPSSRSVAPPRLRLGARSRPDTADGGACSSSRRSAVSEATPPASTVRSLRTVATTAASGGLVPSRGLHAVTRRSLHTLASQQQQQRRQHMAISASARPPVHIHFSRPRLASSMPPELVAKWRDLWLKVVAVALAQIAGLCLMYPVVQDIVRGTEKERMHVQEPVTMPPRTSSLTGRETVRFSGHFIAGDTVLFGPCIIKVRSDASMMSYSSNVLLFPAIGYEVVVPFFCKETNSPLLVNIGWLEGQQLRRYLKHQARTLMAKDNVKDYTLVGSLKGFNEDKFECWDGKWRSVTELTEDSKVEPVVLDLARGPFSDYGHPKAGECVTKNFVTWRKVKSLFVKETRQSLSECIYPKGVLCARYEEIFAQLVFMVCAVGVFLYFRRGGFAGTFYQQYRTLQAETAVSRALKAPTRRKQLKG